MRTTVAQETTIFILYLLINLLITTGNTMSPTLEARQKESRSDRQRHGERLRERDRQTQTERHKNSERGRQTDRQAGRQAHRAQVLPN